MDKKNRCMEKKGEDLIIKVPVGTQVRDFATEINIGLKSKRRTKNSSEKGGRGGYGNVHFKNSESSKIAEKGGEGAEIKNKTGIKAFS